jgi:hypothetical protein
MENKKLGHGGHGRATPPPAGVVGQKPTGKAPGAPNAPRTLSSPAHRAIGGRTSVLTAGAALNPSHVANSIAAAMAGESKLEPWVLKITGFSTPTMRHLVNNLGNVQKRLHYVEAGAYCGGTAVSAVNGNENVTAYVYEDFSQPFDLPNVKEQLLANVKKASQLYLIEGDFFKAELPAMVDIYFYDGNHDEDNQARALLRVADRLQNVSLFLVDDYNWPEVQKGTKRALESVKDKFRVAARWILEGDKKQDDKIWHNGLAIFMLARL